MKQRNVVELNRVDLERAHALADAAEEEISRLLAFRQITEHQRGLLTDASNHIQRGMLTLRLAAMKEANERGRADLEGADMIAPRES